MTGEDSVSPFPDKTGGKIFRSDYPLGAISPSKMKVREKGTGLVLPKKHTRGGVPGGLALQVLPLLYSGGMGKPRKEVSTAFSSANNMGSQKKSPKRRDPGLGTRRRGKSLSPEAFGGRLTEWETHSEELIKVKETSKLTGGKLKSVTTFLINVLKGEDLFEGTRLRP